MLRNQGYKAMGAASGAESLKCVRAQLPDLILLDLMMPEMVQNLLDANRTERGELKLNLAPTNISPALNQVIETQRPHATAKQQTIHLESEPSPATVLVDPSVTVQVLENLVSNAVKYSPLGKDIFVRLKDHALSFRLLQPESLKASALRRSGGLSPPLRRSLRSTLAFGAKSGSLTLVL